MKRTLTITLLTLAALALNHVWQCTATARDGFNSNDHTPSATSETATKTRLAERYGQLPLSFEANRGQTGEPVKFRARGQGYALFLTANEAVLRLQRSADKDAANPKSQISNAKSQMPNLKSATLRMKLVGANPEPQISGQDQLTSRSNYFIGNNPQAWRTDVAHYAKVRYDEVYPGIDLVYYGKQRQLEYDFIVAPGADPRRIQLAFTGVEQMHIAADGDLVLSTNGGEVRQHKPVIYQEVNGERRSIAGRYTFRTLHSALRNQTVGFDLASYDTTKPLVIDPVLSYSTYLGGSGADLATSLSVDAAGNIYVKGDTDSPNFPSANALQPARGGGANDAFILKLNPSGTALIYATYLGGSGREQNGTFAVDAAGNVYVTGETDSDNFPTVNPIQTARAGGTDAFIAKLNPAGAALVYSTYLGGSGNETFINVAVDAAGNAYVAGSTTSQNFPTANAVQPSYGGGNVDCFVAKLNPSGAALMYSTYLGGNGQDQASSIAVDAAGNVYVVGLTGSSNFPTRNPFQPSLGGGVDAFVTKLNADGTALVFSTYLGGSGADMCSLGKSVAVDAGGNVYVVGLTASTNFPTANALQPANGGGQDAFITKLNPSGSALVYSTYLGGSGAEMGFTNLPLGGIAVDGVGQAYVMGVTSSPNFPTVNPVQATLGGGLDVFVTKLNASGTGIVYSTYFGGSNTEFGVGLALDSTGSVYVSGQTMSNDFPSANALQPALGGVSDGFIFKLGADAVTVSAASYSGSGIAGKAIVAAFGPHLSAQTATATSLPLPTTLADTTVLIRDSAGVERLAPLFFVSPQQINYQIPDGTQPGPAAVTVANAGRLSSGLIQVAAAAPSLFTANASGAGAAAAVDAITFARAPFNATQANGQPNIIAVFGTGLGADATDVDGNVNANVQARIDGNVVAVLYAGRVPGLVGLNQFNVMLPAGITAGTHPLAITRNGVASNTVTIAIK